MPFYVRLILAFCALFAWTGAFLTLQPIFLSDRRLFISHWFDRHSLTIAFAFFIVVFAVTGWILARNGKRAKFPIAVVISGLAMLALSTEILLLGFSTSDAERAGWFGQHWQLLRSSRGWIEAFGMLGLGVGGLWFAIRTWRLPQPARNVWRAAGIVYVAAGAAFVVAAFAFFALWAQSEFTHPSTRDQELRHTLSISSMTGTLHGAALACVAISIQGIALNLTRSAR